jgi:hypothetical protein
VTAPKATGSQLQPLIERVLEQRADIDQHPLVLVGADPSDVPPLDVVGGRKVTVHGSRSPLEIRALAQRHHNGPLVILTDLDRAALGDDLLARAGRRIEPLDRWGNVCQAFGAERPSADLVSRPHLADALVEARPLGGYPKVTTKILDLHTAAAALAREYLGISDDRTTLAEFLEWAEEPASVGRIVSSHRELLDDLQSALIDRFGIGVAAALAAVLAGWSDDLVPLGLAAGVIHHPEAHDASPQARLDERLGRPALKAEAYRAWSEAAAARTTTAEDPGRAAGWRQRAEELLGDLQALDLVHLSDVLPAGFDQRIRRAAETLTRWRDHADDHTLATAADKAIRRAAAHSMSHRSPERVERLRMAARLIRRGSLSLTGLDNLATVAGEYAADGAWLDLARTVVSRGDRDPTLAAFCETLTAEADAARLANGPGFARIAKHAAGPLPAGLIGVEDALDTVVAPVADACPVLVVVLDGLGWPTFVEIIGNLEGLGWVQQRRPSDPGQPVALAALPTVTGVSRTSLLAGTVRRGDDGSERRAFASHAGLRGAGHRDMPPVLFHKRDLRAGGLDAYPHELVDEIADVQRRVVGVVINSIDERLKDVVAPPAGWGLADLHPLRALLEAARRAGRAVVVTGDHGHILDRDAEARPHGGGGERWRLAEPPAGDGEIKVAGPRVVAEAAEGEAIVLPWREQLHYATRRNGYHGGLTPQELFVPLVVLSTEDIDDWTPTTVRRPSWWHHVALPSAPAGRPAVREPAPPRAAPAADTPTLFDTAEPGPAAPSAEAQAAVTEVGWVDDLMGSDLFAVQRRNPRVRLGDDEIRRLLGVLDRVGTMAIPEDLLADEAGLPAVRIRRYVAQLQDLLNIDGYPVVSVTEGGVRFDRALLERQFGL